MVTEKRSITLRDIIELLVLPIMTAGVYVLYDLNKNVNSLNVQVGVLIANTSTNEKRVDGIEKRIEKLEERINGTITSQK